ncbi:hypothetical protein EB796_005923 [Bugula neritina]|uniref:Peptidase M28 domain-containing protein n=1 Tax=Bugula neritina TaxID=10212 RepID=A0A7J7KAT3_BUGNE|nr:hypothetical protein EB796_005923 [Bugula neritina]
MAAPRQRLIDPATPTSNFYSNPQLPRIDSKSSGLLALTEKFWLIAIASCLALFVVVDINYHSFPQAQQPKVTLTVSERKSFEWEFKANTFLESNARVFLEKLCSFGTRHLGSKANEESAVTYITDVVKEIKTHANPLHEIELDIQAPSSCFDINFIGNFTTCYMNIKNILVRLSPVNQKSSSALLVNCHYDTAISSPGASDDAISCAIMMESLRLLSQSDQPLTHSIVFNFNGAEEAILQASHGFITQHPWAGQLKAFVNLEAAGSGGREIVFQTGPEHPWLVAAYAESAKYPYASIVAQEIFQSGVIPSDTDFRIYRDYGNIPGIDIAYVYNGYIYHTKYDQPKYIPPGCIQRGGENVLGIITNLANSEKLSDPGDSRLGKMVFFDVLGFFMIHYPLRLGEIINCATILAALLNLYRKIRLFKREGRNPTLYIKLVVASYMMHAAGFVAMVTVNIAIALSVSLVQPMMWYTNNWLVVPVYMLPAVAVWILVHQRGRHVGGANIFQCIYYLVTK